MPDPTATQSKRTVVQPSDVNLLSMILESAKEYGIVTLDLEGRITSWNSGAKRLFGYDDDEAIGQLADIFFTPEDCAAGVPTQEIEGARARRRASDERWHMRKDGSRFWGSGVMLPLENSKLHGFLKIVRDRTAERNAHEALREAEERFHLLADSIPQLAWTAGPDGSIDWYNQRWYDFTGTTPEDVVGWGWMKVHHPDHLDRAVARYKERLTSGQDWDDTIPLRGADGRYRWFLSRAAPIRDAEGRIRLWFGTNTDITDQREAEYALRQSRAELRRLNENLEDRVQQEARDRARIFSVSQELFAVGSPDGYLKTINPAWTRLLGYDEATILSRPIFDFIHPDDRAASMEAFARLRRGERIFRLENRLRRADGRYSQIVWTAVPETDTFYAVGRDVTRQRQVVAERERAEDALRQAQKMEAVGQLTGGVAHDFNNLLTIIIGNLETAQRRLGRTDFEPGAIARFLKSAEQGAQKAAALTRRLLAFSRRQPLDPRPLDPNVLLEGMSDLLHRSLGEQIAVDLVLTPDVWWINVDPNQLENTILNLAVNARDAMPDGGTLTIETANVKLDEGPSRPENLRGKHVVIAVTDSGTGMDPQTLARVFEPFFTTKEPGHGTGLGLAQVHGFVNQSGGEIRIGSAPGEGTTVKIYLPRQPVGHEAPGERPEARPEPRPAATARDRVETILVVEDEQGVRTLSVSLLNELGYEVIAVPDAAAALEIIDQRSDIDLLFTDVGLPHGVNGRELADAARQRNPGLKVLFTSGYAESGLMRDGRLDRGIELLAKPFTYETLATRIREILDSATRAPAVLLLAPEGVDRVTAVDSLEGLGFAVEDVASTKEARARIRAANSQFVAVVIDVDHADRGVDDFARELRTMYHRLPILLEGGRDRAEMRERVAADPRMGHVGKPCGPAELHAALHAMGVRGAR